MLPLVDDVPAHLFHLAQARRLLRFCGERGLDHAAVIAGIVVPDLSDICDADGRVLPEPADLLAVRGT